MAGGSPDTRGRDVFEFGERQTRSTYQKLHEGSSSRRGYSPPLRDRKNGQRSRGTPEGGHREGMSHFPGRKLEQICLFRGIPVSIKHVGFSSHTVQRRTTPAVLMNPIFELGGSKRNCLNLARRPAATS